MLLMEVLKMLKMNSTKNIPPEKLEELKEKLGKVKISEQKASVSEGQSIPSELSLPSTSGNSINISKAADEANIVIFVYPGDKRGLEYPELWGCTPEACSFKSNVEKFKEQNTIVFGLSMQSTERQKAFIEREKLPFQILSDADKKFVSTFGIPIWTSEQGEQFPDRTTLVIKKGGTLEKIFPDVVIKNHVEDVLEFIQGLSCRSSLSCRT
jgi:thioredoxin-dependent peroxiredoxin